MNNKTFRKELPGRTARCGELSRAGPEHAARQQRPGRHPQVDRRDIEKPKFPSNDFEIGLFTGSYATQNFGSSWVYGARIGYHITEDFFVEGVYGADQGQRRAVPADPAGRHLPAGHGKARLLQPVDRLQPVPRRDLHRRQAGQAVPVLPHRRRRQHQVRRSEKPTFNVGFGYRVYLADWVALQLDLRDHIFSLDLLGKRQNTQNLELTGGLTFYF